MRTSPAHRRARVKALSEKQLRNIDMQEKRENERYEKRMKQIEGM